MRTYPLNAPTRRAVLTHSASLLSSCLVSLRAPVPAVATPEPPAAAEERLYELCRGRRPSEWTVDQRHTVDDLVSELVSLGRRTPWSRSALRGKWRLVYVQPGPQQFLYPAAARPLLFPELPWNDSYQIVGVSDVINVGELAGPLLEVRAAGRLAEQDVGGGSLPKRFQADLSQGALCASITVGAREKANTGRLCGPLPIRGDGSFDALYVGPRVRVSQNVDSGGARTVHVRIRSFGGFE